MQLARVIHKRATSMLVNTYIREDVRLCAAAARPVVREEHELRGHGGTRAPREELQRAVIPAVNHACRCARVMNE